LDLLRRSTVKKISATARFATALGSSKTEYRQEDLGDGSLRFLDPQAVSKYLRVEFVFDYYVVCQRSEVRWSGLAKLH